MTYKSPLHEMTQTTPTCLWNDSAAIEELTYSIEHGAVGATCNPVIVVAALKKEMSLWINRIRALIDEHPTATEDQIGWQLVREISVKSAALLKPTLTCTREGMEDSPSRPTRAFIATREAIVEQAEEFSRLAPNMIVKIPVTSAGIPAIEEATYRGISINATVCFSLPQCIAVAEAVERGLQRRESEGKEIVSMGPVCTIMVGRLDDWLKVVVEKERITIDPGYLEWAGVAVFKKTYQCSANAGTAFVCSRRRSATICTGANSSAATSSFRRPTHGRFVSTRATFEIKPRIDNPVDPKIVAELSKKVADFRRAYTEGGISIDEFNSFAPTRRTLRQFIAACGDLNSIVRDVMLPNPDAA